MENDVRWQLVELGERVSSAVRRIALLEREIVAVRDRLDGDLYDLRKAVEVLERAAS